MIAELTSEVERLNAEVQLLRRSTSPVDPEQSLPEETTPDLRLALSEHILLPPPQIFAEQSTQTPETPSNPQPVAMVDAEASTYEQQAIPVDQSSQAYPSMAEIGTSCSPSQLDLGALTDRTYDWTGSPILSSVSPIETSGLTRDISTESLDTAASPWSIDSGDILQDYSSMEPEPSGFDDPFSFGEQVEDSIDDGAVAAIMFPGGKTYFVAKDERQVAAGKRQVDHLPMDHS